MTKNTHPETNPEAAALLKRAYSLGNEKEAKALYAEWAETYDATMLDELGYLTPQRTAKLLCTHLADDQARILDVGSGTGLAGLELSRLGYEVLDALDYSPQMLAVAKSRGVYDRLIEADLNESLGLEDEIYDALICTGTFTHAHVGAACLPELFRIMKPGGLFACTVHKDIWEPAGFEAMTGKLEADKTLKTLFREEGTYYTKSEEPEGWFILWQKV